MSEKIENETSAKVSNEQLLSDIELTGRELEAYQKLQSGYATLMGIPENIQSGKAVEYRVSYYLYCNLESECARFLRQLHQLKAERGL